jgi:glycosyltransferase involved in cell wall biosynthesis
MDYPEDRTIVVHGGVDLSRYQPSSALPDPARRDRWRIAPDEIAILYAGAVVPEKGLVELLRALHRVRNAHADLRWRLLIAGDAGLWRTIEAGPGNDVYTSRARELSRGLPIAWLGVIPEHDMPELYAAVDLVTCPSIWDDPFPTVNLEAMAASRPVVASRVGGVPEAVQDGTTGLLVPPGDDAALADALASLIADPEQRRRLGDAGRSASRKFTIAAAARRLEDLYREALECA